MNSDEIDELIDGMDEEVSEALLVGLDPELSDFFAKVAQALRELKQAQDDVARMVSYLDPLGIDPADGGPEAEYIPAMRIRELQRQLQQQGTRKDGLLRAAKIVKELRTSHQKDTGECEEECDFVAAWETAEQAIVKEAESE